MDAQAKMISISKVSSYLWAIQHVFLVIAHRVISFLLDAVSDCRLSIQRFFCCCCWLCIKIKGSSFRWTDQICVFRAKIIHFSSVTPICSAHLKNLKVILAPPIGKTCHGKCEGPFSYRTRARAHMTSPAERWKPDWIVALFPTNS